MPQKYDHAEWQHYLAQELRRGRTTAYAERHYPVWHRFLKRQAELGRSRAHAEEFYPVWLQSIAVQTLVRHNCSSTSIRKQSTVCSISKEAAQMLATSFGIPAAHICESLACVINVSTDLYLPTSMKSSGSFGVALAAHTRGGCASIAKVYHMHKAETKEVKGLDHSMYTVKPYMFHAAVLVAAQLAMAGIPVPRITDAHEIPASNDSNSSIGIMFMTYAGSTDVYELMVRGTQKECAGYAHSMGAILGRMHRAGFVHGDAHTPNFVVGGSSGVSIIDFDTAFAFDAAVDPQTRKRCEGYDLSRMLQSLLDTKGRRGTAFGECMLRTADAAYRNTSSLRSVATITEQCLLSEVSDLLEKNFYMLTFQQQQRSAPKSGL